VLLLCTAKVGAGYYAEKQLTLCTHNLEWAMVMVLLLLSPGQ
jgi:hypothetical protein